MKNNAASAIGTGGRTVRVLLPREPERPYDQIYQDGMAHNLVNRWNDNASMDLWACTEG